VWRHHAWDREQLLRFQDNRLRRVIRHAGQNIPFYRDLYAKSGVDCSAFSGHRDLRRLPMVTKLELREVPAESLLPPGRRTQDLVPGRTSGTTGLKLFLWREPFEQHLIHTFRMRAWRQIGVRFRDRIARVSLDPPKIYRLTRLREAVGVFRQDQVPSTQTPEEIFAQLEALAPDVLIGYAGVLYGVARAARKRATQALRPRIIVTVAERLNAAMRAEIEEVFGVPVFDFYVSLEFNLMAWPCSETGLYHLCEDNVACELLDGNRPVEEGEQGEVVLTGLHSFTTPLLRYRIGDVAERGPTPCPCGQPFATLHSIQGRTMEYFDRGDGTRIHHWELSRHILEVFRPHVELYQLVQESPGRVVMRLVPQVELQEGTVAAIESRGREKFGPAVEFAVEVVEEIPVAPSGKMIQSVNQVDSPNQETTFDFAGWQARKPTDTERSR
jgi:phenylacetate-CoA ligase